MIRKLGKRFAVAAALALLAGCAGPTTSSFVPNSGGSSSTMGTRAAIERHSAAPTPAPTPSLPPLNAGVIGRPGLPGGGDTVIGRPGLPGPVQF